MQSLSGLNEAATGDDGKKGTSELSIHRYRQYIAP
jgi:hypothetical protein